MTSPRLASRLLPMGAVSNGLFRCEREDWGSWGRESWGQKRGQGAEIEKLVYMLRRRFDTNGIRESEQGNRAREGWEEMGSEPNRGTAHSLHDHAVRTNGACSSTH